MPSFILTQEEWYRGGEGAYSKFNPNIRLKGLTKKKTLQETSISIYEASNLWSVAPFWCRSRQFSITLRLTEQTYLKHKTYTAGGFHWQQIRHEILIQQTKLSSKNHEDSVCHTFLFAIKAFCIAITLRVII